MINEGNAVVIQMQNTYEAQLNRALARMEDINDIRLEPAELLSFADALPTIEHEIIEEPDEKGKIRSVYRQKLDGDGNPVHNAEAVEYKNRKINDVRELKLPLQSLDQNMLAFGPGRQAEVTGRSKRSIPNKPKGAQIGR